MNKIGIHYAYWGAVHSGIHLAGLSQPPFQSAEGQRSERGSRVMGPSSGRRIWGRVLLAVVLCLAVMSFVPHAEGSIVHALDVNVTLDRDGTAHFTQRWDAELSAGGTEFLLALDPDVKVTDFSVADEWGRVFENEGRRWNPQRSAAEKEGRCGVVRGARGLELRWGRAASGRSVCYVSWTVPGLVKAYDDADGFLVRFLDRGTDPMPRRVQVRIRRADGPLAEGQAEVRTHGFRGVSQLVSGTVVVRSSRPLKEDNYIAVKLRLPKGVLHPHEVLSGRFEYVRDSGRAGRDADGESLVRLASVCGRLSKFSDYLQWILALGFLAVVFLRISASRSPSRMLRVPPAFFEELEDRPYFGSIPCGGDLAAAFYGLSAVPRASVLRKLFSSSLFNWMQPHVVSHDHKRLTDLIRAYVLRWFRDGILLPSSSTLPIVEDERRLRSEPERKLMELLKAFRRLKDAEAGTRVPLDLSLSSAFDALVRRDKDIDARRRDFAEEGRRQALKMMFEDWRRSVEDAGFEYFLSNGGIVQRNRLLRRGRAAPSKPRATRRGLEMLRQLRGFRNYLEDFTLINERRAVEVELWDEYLVFAVLYGIGDRVEGELRALCSDLPEAMGFSFPGLLGNGTLLLEASHLSQLLYSASGTPDGIPRT